MKICAFGRSLPVHQLGGMERHFQMISNCLAKLGHQITIITTKHPQDVEFEEINRVKIYYLPNTLSGRYEYGYWPKSTNLFRQLMARQHFDVILSQSAGCYGYLRQKAKDHFKVPVVLVAHGTALGEFKTKLRQHLLSPKILVGMVKNLNSHFRDKRLFPYLDCIVSVSPFIHDQIQKDYRIHSSKRFLLANGIDQTLFRPDPEKRKSIRQQLRLDKNANVLLCSGRLHQEKGIQLVLQGLPELLRTIPSVYLLIIGSGPYRNVLNQMIEKLGLGEHVFLLGEIVHAKMVDYYNAADLYLMPSLRVEGLPLSLLEAMACCKPVIASRIGGISSVLQDGVNGLLIEPNDSFAIIHHVIELLNNETLASSLGHSARKDIIKKYNRNRMMKELDTILHLVVERAKPTSGRL